MKKIHFLTAGMLSFALSGCSGGDKGANAGADTLGLSTYNRRLATADHLVFILVLPGVVYV
jgi:hypothetical protein